MENITAPAGEEAAPKPTPSTPSPAPSPEPSPTPAPTPEAAPAAPSGDPTAPAPAAPTKTLDQLLQEETDPERLEALMEQAEKVAKSSSKPAAPKPQAEPAATVEPKPAEPAPEPEEADDADLVSNRPRLTFLEENDKRVVNAALKLVRANQAGGGTMSIAEAVAIVSSKGKPSATPATEPAAPPVEPAAPEPAENSFDQQISAQEKAIGEIRTKLKAARQSFDDEQVESLSDELTDAKIKLSHLQRDKQQAIEDREFEQEAARQSAYNQSIEEALEILPGCKTPGHPDFLACQQMVAEYEKTNPVFLQNPDYPLLIASRIAAKQRKAAAPTAPPAPREEPTPPPAPARPARPAVPQVGGDATSEQPQDRAALWKKVEDITDPEEIERLADAVGTQAPDPRRK